MNRSIKYLGEKIEIKFDWLKYVKKTDSCWIKNKSEEKRKYPYFSIVTKGKKKKINAHKFSYLLNKGNIDDGLHVCHSCDNFLCVNPDHLFAESPSKNRYDAYKRGRQMGVSKLNHSEREAIYFFANGERNHSLIARVFGVTPEAVGALCKRWGAKE